MRLPLPKEYVEEPESYLEKMKSGVSVDQEPGEEASYDSWVVESWRVRGGGRHGKSNVLPFRPSLLDPHHERKYLTKAS